MPLKADVSLCKTVTKWPCQFHEDVSLCSTPYIPDYSPRLPVAAATVLFAVAVRTELPDNVSLSLHKFCFVT